MELSQWWYSPLGVAVCDDCHRSWPCHLLAWGNPEHWSRCAACGGQVWWSAIDDDNESLQEA